MLTEAQTAFALKLYPAARACYGLWNIPPSYSIGEAIQESWTKAGKPSRLAEEAHNYWGIKAFSSWTGPTVQLDTFEFVQGKKVFLAGEHAPKWRKYPDDFAAFGDYGKILNGPLYKSAQRFLPNDIHSFCHEVSRHWATDPLYAKHVEAIEDLIAADIPSFEFLEALMVAIKAVQQTLAGGQP